MEQIKIGDQTWSSKNLDVDTFRNGDSIPHAETEEQWEEAGKNGTPAWCYYDNDPANGETYGKLYNWYAVSDPRGLAPEGWHIPSDDEWERLTDHLGGEYVACTKMKSTSGWADGVYLNSNESGFSGLPGGYRLTNGTFNSFGKAGIWWSSTEDLTNYAWSRALNYIDGYVDRSPDYKENGFSVRCLRD